MHFQLGELSAGNENDFQPENCRQEMDLIFENVQKKKGEGKI